MLGIIGRVPIGVAIAIFARYSDFLVKMQLFTSYLVGLLGSLQVFGESAGLLGSLLSQMPDALCEWKKNCYNKDSDSIENVVFIQLYYLPHLPNQATQV